MLSEIRLKCNFNKCDNVIGYDSYQSHLAECIYNPYGTLVCAYCQCEHVRMDTEAHQSTCVEYLRSTNVKLEKNVEQLESQITELDHLNRDLLRKVQYLTPTNFKLRYQSYLWHNEYFFI